MAESASYTPDGSQEVRIELETKFSKYIYKVSWRLTNLSLFKGKIGEFIDSNTFTTNFEGKKNEWCLRMYPFGSTTEHAGYVSLFLAGYSECTASYKLEILDRENIARCGRSAEDYLFKNNFAGHHKFVKRNDLFDESSKLLVNGALNVLCVITMIHTINVRNPSVPGSVAMRQLLKDLADMHKSSRLSDLTLTAGGRKFTAHRAILAARSPVFSAMFEHDMLENSSGVVDIPDTSPEAMEALLLFVYTGECPNISNVAGDLLELSEKYQLAQLKQICSCDLSDRLTILNAVSTLVLADRYNAVELKERVIHFFALNFDEINISPDWKNLAVTDPRLNIEVMSMVIDKMKLQKSF